ncbi:winged helix-turn-helix transcriptional regulator [Pedobacter hartonius]|uniref:Transcriptional regulator, HxlR family n=1 Tax=Pedobacter hartonius TaxID=425514 RepID=A0A1H3W0I7_9SPHI|nr:helix-turn-helix domain-containing protein [Pedobacter hartonius]SDZ80431.1 transcriptional regulator, HxlR family [Pedobacter hartonius]
MNTRHTLLIRHGLCCRRFVPGLPNRTVPGLFHIIAVSFGSKRFKELAREIPGITDKTLSKELKDLEMNQLVSRTVINSFPTRVEYQITDYGRTLKNLMIELRSWGRAHRVKILNQN